MKNNKTWKVLNVNGIYNNIKRIIETKNIDLLTKASYKFLYLTSGFIAHYDINGFKAHYSEVADLITNLKRSSDLRDYDRYIKDGFFQKDDHSKDYYTSKSALYKKLYDYLEGINLTRRDYTEMVSVNRTEYNW